MSEMTCATQFLVMAGLVPAIHDLDKAKTWMPGTMPGRTNVCFSRDGEIAE
jgi:hypothetical protein